MYRQHTKEFVEFKGWYENDQYMAIAMELIEHGDLEKYMGGTAKPDGIEAQQIAGQVLAGLELMHSHGFTHRDLKPQVNISNLPLKKPRANHLTVHIEHLRLRRHSKAAHQNRRFRHLQTCHHHIRNVSPNTCLHPGLRRPGSGPEKR